MYQWWNTSIAMISKKSRISRIFGGILFAVSIRSFCKNERIGSIRFCCIQPWIRHWFIILHRWSNNTLHQRQGGSNYPQLDSFFNSMSDVQANTRVNINVPRYWPFRRWPMDSHTKAMRKAVSWFHVFRWAGWIRSEIKYLNLYLLRIISSAHNTPLYT